MSEIKQPGWEAELTAFVQDDIDGRFWLDDMVALVLDGTITTQSYEDHLRHESEQVNEEYFKAGHEVGYEDGYSDGQDYAAEEEYEEGYAAGYKDGEAGKRPVY